MSVASRSVLMERHWQVGAGTTPFACGTWRQVGQSVHSSTGIYLVSIAYPLVRMVRCWQAGVMTTPSACGTWRQGYTQLTPQENNLQRGDFAKLIDTTATHVESCVASQKNGGNTVSYEAMEHIMKTAVDNSDDIKEDLRKREGAFGRNADVDVVDVCGNVHEIGCDVWTVSSENTYTSIRTPDLEDLRDAWREGPVQAHSHVTAGGNKYG